jgi:hypothetical protein
MAVQSHEADRFRITVESSGTRIIFTVTKHANGDLQHGLAIKRAGEAGSRQERERFTLKHDAIISEKLCEKPMLGAGDVRQFGPRKRSMHTARL